MFLIGFVILILEMELAMARRLMHRGSNSAAAPFAEPAAPQRFSGAFRSRRRQLTHIPINPPRSASEHCTRGISSRPPCLPRALHSLAGPAAVSPSLHTAPRPQERTTHTYSIHARHCSHALSLRERFLNLSRTNGVHPAFTLDPRARPTRNSCTRKKDGYELMAESLNALSFALEAIASVGEG
ncbi:unnamed protein product [Colias eurytheme]|nr:unnamed protein product [Colias eurytheme]